MPSMAYSRARRLTVMNLKPSAGGIAVQRVTGCWTKGVMSFVPDVVSYWRIETCNELKVF
jgi:hypothetical protein